MKYLYTILAIIGGATVITLLLLLPEKKVDPGEIALSINGRNFGKEMVAGEGKKHGYHSDEQAEIIDNIITRELLIQEAERREIHKEESFRQSLKSYYENSLVKTLLDRQNETLQVSVSEDEINGYLGYLGKVVTFSRLETIPASPAEAEKTPGVSNTALFSELATPVRLLLASLKPSQFAVKYDTGSEAYALRLDSVQDGPEKASKPVERERVREMLIGHKKEQQMNRWLVDLRQKATITIHNENR
jgi:hypothetical protein